MNEQEETKMQWFKVIGYRAHVGTNKEQTISIAIYERGSIEALDRYKTIPGIKKKMSSSKIPDVSPFDESDKRNLELRIMRSNTTLQRAKETWFFLN